MFDETRTLESPTGARIAYHYRTASQAPRGILIVSHGLAEHARRYRRFAENLADAGFHVYAPDHRGHGETAAPDAPLGRFASRDGWRAVLDDLLALREHAAETHPDLPVVLFGHSMGGLFALAFAEAFPEKLDAVAVWNSNFAVGLSGRAAQAILAAERMLKGSDVPSGLLPRLTFGAWGKSIANRKTDLDWLSHDEAEVAAYIADPLCGFDASVSLWIDLFAVTFSAIAPQRIARLPKDLPIHLLGGGQDPATNGGEAIRWLAARLEKSGLEDVTTIVYPGARHETLNEIPALRDEATDAFIAWCRRVTERPHLTQR